MTRTAGGWRGCTRTRAVVDWEVADPPDESAYPGSCGVSVNRWQPADRAGFRWRLLSCDAPCDGRSDALSDLRPGDMFAGYTTLTLDAASRQRHIGEGKGNVVYCAAFTRRSYTLGRLSRSRRRSGTGEPQQFRAKATYWGSCTPASPHFSQFVVDPFGGCIYGCVLRAFVDVAFELGGLRCTAA